MLAIQAVLDVFVYIDLVYDLIGIVLEGSSEDHDLVEFGHKFDEVNATRPHQKVAVTSVFYVVDQSLIQVKH